jgi:hypothetical protein
MPAARAAGTDAEAQRRAQFAVGPATSLTARAPTGGQSPASAGRSSAAPEPETALLTTVRENLRRERERLLDYVYRERRQPMRVSRLGKVSVEAVQLFEVYPTGDPDRPRRVLVSVGGRPATEEEREAFARRHARDAPAEEARRAEETRRRAQERFDDAFRVYRFELQGSDTVDGIAARVVAVTPRPGAQTRSDLGKWMKRFEGTAWVSETAAELLRLEMVATGTISLGWGFIGRIAEGTRITYARRPVGDGVWLPALARFEARGRTLLFRSFEVDTRTEWFDYRPYVPAGAAESRASGGPGARPLR